ncbi:hypothetical protein B0H14DRAFT_2597389 [Mycena olivaceomarginata]|nr:hypothetical protein B0H14DRAFT_2597389 [Mycena olivaceomarginata]
MYPILCLKLRHNFLQSSRLWNQWTAPVSTKNTQKHKFRHLVCLQPDTSLAPKIVKTSEKRPRVNPSVAKLRVESAQEMCAWYEECYCSEGSWKKDYTPVDYEVEWVLYQQMKEEEKRQHVAETLYVAKQDKVPVTCQDGTQGYIYL